MLKAAATLKSNANTYRRSVEQRKRKVSARRKRCRNRVSVQATALRQSLVSQRESITDEIRRQQRRSSLSGLYQATGHDIGYPEGLSPTTAVIRLSRLSVVTPSLHEHDETKMNPSSLLFRMIDIQNTGKIFADDAVKFLDEHALLRTEDIQILTNELLKDGSNTALTESSFDDLLHKLNCT